jgi:hypothetical protein
MPHTEEPKLTHGYEIHSEHHSALDFMGNHMNEHQVRQMVERAKSGHSADFRITHDGHFGDFKLEHHDGKLVVHESHHN